MAYLRVDIGNHFRVCNSNFIYEYIYPSWSKDVTLLEKLKYLVWEEERCTRMPELRQPN